ncbi:MAG: hypothetical protein V2I51_19485 [Anderseniella sp.]|nr:hypothetical protein [Anderseniella sp.]
MDVIIRVHQLAVHFLDFIYKTTNDNACFATFERLAPGRTVELANMDFEGFEALATIYAIEKSAQNLLAQANSPVHRLAPKDGSLCGHIGHSDWRFKPAALDPLRTCLCIAASGSSEPLTTNANYDFRTSSNSEAASLSSAAYAASRSVTCGRNPTFETISMNGKGL